MPAERVSQDGEGLLAALGGEGAVGRRGREVLPRGRAGDGRALRAVDVLGGSAKLALLEARRARRARLDPLQQDVLALRRCDRGGAVDTRRAPLDRKELLRADVATECAPGDKRARAGDGWRARTPPRVRSACAGAESTRIESARGSSRASANSASVTFCSRGFSPLVCSTIFGSRVCIRNGRFEYLE